MAIDMKRLSLNSEGAFLTIMQSLTPHARNNTSTERKREEKNNIFGKLDPLCIHRILLLLPGSSCSLRPIRICSTSYSSATRSWQWRFSWPSSLAARWVDCNLEDILYCWVIILYAELLFLLLLSGYLQVYIVLRSGKSHQENIGLGAKASGAKFNFRPQVRTFAHPSSVTTSTAPAAGTTSAGN